MLHAYLLHLSAIIAPYVWPFLCCAAPAPFPRSSYLAHLLRAVSDQRYRLFGTFLNIPLGLTRALVTQNMHLLDEDGSDSDDDEDDHAGNRGNQQVTGLCVGTHVQLVLEVC